MSANPNLASFRQRLEARREELKALQEISAGSRGAVELDQTSVGRVSRIDAIQQQQMALASERQRKEELVRIDAALQRIADGSYGECLVCEEPIAEKRLEFDPSIATCIDCAARGGR
jgi:RNA polymerase-binding transcription factor